MDGTAGASSAGIGGTPAAPAASRKLGTLELGRFIAAFTVLLSHMPWFIERFSAGNVDPVLGGWIAPGQFAVQYFFSLSGFVMVVAHLRDAGRQGGTLRFWWRRAIRIYPMYWLALAMTLGLTGLVGAHGQLPVLVTLAPVAVQSVLPQAWSLHLEVGFYLIFGLCLLPRIGRTALALWVILVVLGCWLPGYQGLLHVPMAMRRPAVLYLFGTTFTFFHVQFLGGMLAGWLYLKRPLGRRGGFVLLGLSLAALLATGPALHWWRLYYLPRMVPLIAFGFAGLILALASLERAGAWRSGAAARRLGTVSYPLYILHTSMMLLFVQLVPHFELGTFGLYLLFAATLAAVLLANFAVAYGLDQPLQRLLRTRPRSPAPLASGSAGAN